MEDAEIATELQSIQERLAQIAAALTARGEPRTHTDRIATDELDSLSNEELRRLAEGPE